MNTKEAMKLATARPWERAADVIYSFEGKATVAAVSEPRVSKYVRFQPLDICSKDHVEAFANAVVIQAAVNSLSLGVELAEAVMDPKITFEQCEQLAREFLRVAGVEGCS